MAGTGWAAIILAAGLGTRLRPLSLQLPKPLFPLANLPLLALQLRQLAVAGCRRVAINLHYRADQIAAFLAANCPPDLEIHLSYEPAILGTGGVFRPLAGFIGAEPVLVLNGDIVTDLDLRRLWEDYDPDAIATLFLHDYPRFNRVWLNARRQLVGFAPSPPPPGSLARAYTGIQIITPRLLALLPPGYSDIITIYRQALAAGDPPAVRLRQGFYWQDIGTPAAYVEVHWQLLQGRLPRLAAFFPPLTDPYFGPGAVIDPEVVWGGGVCLGPGVKVGRGACLTRTVVWAEATIAPGVTLTDCIVGQGVQVDKSTARACLTAAGNSSWD